MQRPRWVAADAGDQADREQSGEAADGRGQRAEHAEFSAGIAIVGVERITDETAVAGLGAEQRDLALKLLRGGRKQRHAERRGYR